MIEMDMIVTVLNQISLICDFFWFSIFFFNTIARHVDGQDVGAILPIDKHGTAELGEEKTHIFGSEAAFLFGT